MTDLAKLQQLVDDDEAIHEDKLEDLGVDRVAADWLVSGQPVPQLLACVYCDAPWTPTMIELVELSGYCETCADSERVIDVFCSACTRLVYRKKV